MFFPAGLLLYADHILAVIEKKKAAFLGQFTQALRLISQSLQTGYSAENSIRAACEELHCLYPPSAHIIRSFQEMTRKMDLNIPLEQALSDFAAQTGSDEVSSFIFIFTTAKRMGGDSIRIISDCLSAMKEKLDIEQEIQLLLRAKRLEFHVMCAVPFFIILYMKLMFRDFISALYFNPIGVTLMTGCLLTFIISYIAGRRIIHIQV